LLKFFFKGIFAKLAVKNWSKIRGKPFCTYGSFKKIFVTIGGGGLER